MKFTPLLWMMVILVALSACESRSPKADEVTRSISQTVEVTRIVSRTIIATKIIEVTSIPMSENLINSTEMTTQGIDPTYYDGIISITRYYTFLDHGIYEDAYKLLSINSRRHSPTLDDYVNMVKSSFESVRIVTIQPYYLWSNQQHRTQTLPETNEERRFYVQIITNEEGNVSGSSSKSGVVQTFFLTLIQEDSQWKIDAFSTAPWWP